MITLKNCPVCGGGSFRSDLSCKDYTVSGETFTLLKCDGCSFLFTNPRPNDGDLGSYYKSEDYISHNNTRKGIISKLYLFVRNYTVKRKVNLISAYSAKGSILDYGCGTGVFLKACDMSAWKAFGVEPDSGARKLASEIGLNVFSNLDDIRGEDKFQVITLWHVLEHVADLKHTLSFFKGCLSESGSLIIAVPNHLSDDAVYYDQFWAAYDVPRHLYHFSKGSVSQLLSNFGFELVAVKPMKFDSFYVSMLSEKYKTGRVRYLKAFLRGLISNIKARSTGNYSSLIYVFQHKV